MEITHEKTGKINVKTIRVYAKTSDRFECKLLDERREVIGRYDGYVPDFFPEDHYGDYLILDIDLETGQITNWQRPTEEDLLKLLFPPKYPMFE